jgi:hypothetical protein
MDAVTAYVEDGEGGRMTLYQVPSHVPPRIAAKCLQLLNCAGVPR